MLSRWPRRSPRPLEVIGCDPRAELRCESLRAASGPVARSRLRTARSLRAARAHARHGHHPRRRPRRLVAVADDRSPRPSQPGAVRRVVADLHLVADLWPGLAHARIPGSALGSHEPSLTAERQAELDHEARLERLERNELMPGEHVDAVRPEILDLMGSVVCGAEDLAEQVSLAVCAPVLPPPSTALADPRPYLARAAGYLPLAAGGGHGSRGLLIWAAGAARQMAAEVGAALGLGGDGQLLRVPCPWCRGGWFGARTLRVRVLPGDLIGIVCESGLCTPPAGDVGTWWQGRPVWPFAMWPWLARRMHAAEQRRGAAGVVIADA